MNEQEKKRHIENALLKELLNLELSIYELREYMVKRANDNGFDYFSNNYESTGTGNS